MKIKFLRDVGYAYAGYVGDYDPLDAERLVKEGAAELVQDAPAEKADEAPAPKRYSKPAE